jgi:hypothetical protein
MTWRQAAAGVSAGIGLLCPLNVYSACWGDADVVTEYLFYDDGDDVVVNTGIDEDDGNAALINGADFSGDVPPSNLNCGWSVSIPGTGSGAGTPAVETDEEYDPFAGASRFTIMAWVRRESSSTGSNTSARVVSDTSSLTLNGATAGVEFRFGGSAGSLYLRVNGNEVGTTTSSISPDSGEWRHVAVVYDGTRPATNYLTRNVHFYVDGIQCGHGNVLQSVVVGTNASRLTLGNSAVSRGIGNTMVGKMDDVIILYDVAPEAVGNGNSNETIRCYMELNDDIVPRPLNHRPMSRWTLIPTSVPAPMSTWASRSQATIAALQLSPTMRHSYSLLERPRWSGRRRIMQGTPRPPRRPSPLWMRKRRYLLAYPTSRSMPGPAWLR